VHFVSELRSQISYAVYRNGTQVGTTAAGVTSYADTGLAASTNYTYIVSASDPAQNTFAQPQA
jgi:chitinase